MRVARILAVAVMLWWSSACIAQIAPFMNPMLLGSPPIAAPVLIASSGLNSNTSSCTITTTATAPAGSIVVAVYAINGTPTTPTATDSNSNSYTKQISGGSFQTGLFSSGILAAPLNSGSTITINFTVASGNDQMCAAAYVTVASSTVDKTNSGTASANTISVATGALSNSSEVVFGVSTFYNSGSSPGTITEGNGFTALYSPSNFGGDHITSDFAYKIVSTSSTVTYNPSSTTAVSAAAIVASYH